MPPGFGRARNELNERRVVRRNPCSSKGVDISSGVSDDCVGHAQGQPEQDSIEHTATREGVVRRIDHTPTAEPADRQGEKRERSACGDSLDVHDRPRRTRSMKMGERSCRQPHGDARGAEGATPLVTRPPRARAQVDSLGIHRLVLVTGMEDEPQVLAVQQLANPARMLKDTGVARRLEQMDFPWHRNPGVLSDPGLSRMDFRFAGPRYGDPPSSTPTLDAGLHASARCERFTQGSSDGAAGQR
jgi:hypothetical protein